MLDVNIGYTLGGQLWQNRHMAGELSRAIAADLTVTRANLEYLHVLWQLDKAQ